MDKNSKIKVSLLIYSLSGGGAERVASILLRELHSQFDFHLVLMNNTVRYDIPLGTKIHLLENSSPRESGFLKFLKLPLLAWRYRRFCRKEGIDLSLAFMNRPCYVSLIAKFMGCPIPFLISERSTPSRIYGSNSISSVISRCLVRYLYPKADLLIANSHGNRADLVDNFGLDARNVKTIQNPVDIDLIKRLSTEDVEIPGDDEAFTCLAVGRLDAGKNHKLLLSVVARISERQKVRLVILGQGPLEEVIQRQITDMGLEESVFLVGFDSNPYRWMARADCFLFSSRYEGFPNVVVEALACGLPVISTDCPSGPREILSPETPPSFRLNGNLEEAPFGILVPVDDELRFYEALKRLIMEPGLREHYRNASVQRVESFRKEPLVAEYGHVLRAFFPPDKAIG